jgi:hypothetical protein
MMSIQKPRLRLPTHKILNHRDKHIKPLSLWERAVIQLERRMFDVYHEGLY